MSFSLEARVLIAIQYINKQACVRQRDMHSDGAQDQGFCRANLLSGVRGVYKTVICTI
jgi:hypothetical protein